MDILALYMLPKEFLPVPNVLPVVDIKDIEMGGSPHECTSGERRAADAACDSGGFGYAIYRWRYEYCGKVGEESWQ